MTAELWLHRLCLHGHLTPHWVAESRTTQTLCQGGSQRRLDPDKVVTPENTDGGIAFVSIRAMIDALEEE